MRLSPVLLGVAGAAAGLLTAAAAYQATATPPRPADAPAASMPGRAMFAPRPQYDVRVAACHRPARLRHGACVTKVTRTRVVHDAPAAPTIPAPSGRATAGSTPSAQPTPTTGPSATASTRPRQDRKPPEPGDD